MIDHERPLSPTPDKKEMADVPWQKRRILVGFLTTCIVLISFAIIVFAANSGDFNNVINTGNWEPSDELAGIRIGMTEEQVIELKGEPGGYYGSEENRNNILAWHYRTSRRPGLLVHFDQRKVVKIETFEPRYTGDKVPFESVEEMHKIIGQEDILSEFGFQSRYTYSKWMVSYYFGAGGQVVYAMSLGYDDWFLVDKNIGRYYIKGQQVCPSEACPWNDLSNLKAEYQNASFEDFISPSSEVAKMLSEAVSFERERDRKNAEESAIQIYGERANQGEALAQYLIGNMYLDAGISYGAIEDYPKAFKWLSLAANQDYSEAQYKLGKMYEDGLGLTQDYSKAFELYEQAAEKNFDAAQSSLGSMYMNGTGVPKDNVLAYMWFQLSAMGDNDALKNKEILENIMTHDELQKANAMRKKWWDNFTSKK